MLGIIRDLIKNLVIVGILVMFGNWLNFTVPWWVVLPVAATVTGIKVYHSYSIFCKDERSIEKISNGIKLETWVTLTHKNGRKYLLYYYGHLIRHEIIRNDRGCFIGYGFRKRYVVEVTEPQGYSGDGIDWLIPGCEIISIEPASPPSGSYWL